MDTRESVMLADFAREGGRTRWRPLQRRKRKGTREGCAGFPAPTVTSEPHVPPGPQSGPQGQCVHGPPGTRSGRGLPAAGAAGPEVLPLGPAWGAGRPAPERQAPGRRALRGGAASVDGDWERHLLTNENVTESTE